MRQDEVVNPWAVCHAQLGKKKTKKFERCVMKVKAKHGIKEDAGILASIAGRGLYDLGKAGARLLRQKVAARRQRPKTEVAVEENSHLDEQDDYISWFLNEVTLKSLKGKRPSLPTRVRAAGSRVARGVRKQARKDYPHVVSTAAGAAKGAAMGFGMGAEGGSTPIKGVLGGTIGAGVGGLAGFTASRAAKAGVEKATKSTVGHQEAPVLSKAEKKVAQYKRIKAKLPAREKKKKAILGDTGRGSRGILRKDHTEHEGPSLSETKDWIQGAINPAHKGYCTPMTKETCTPARKAFAKRAKRGDI